MIPTEKRVSSEAAEELIKRLKGIHFESSTYYVDSMRRGLPDAAFMKRVSDVSDSAAKALEADAQGMKALVEKVEAARKLCRSQMEEIAAEHPKWNDDTLMQDAFYCDASTQMQTLKWVLSLVPKAALKASPQIAGQAKEETK